MSAATPPSTPVPEEKQGGGERGSGFPVLVTSQSGDHVGLSCAPPSTLLVLLKLVTCWDEGLAKSLSLCFYFSVVIS